ncbi:putative reverse transcriptase [Soybean chlorotic mottle virus]|uniref:Enzymatic polyprotein n=1 Tax=Soybean chlorotic mottle virus TaxID=10651 RepID=POL_SOCMV|nr:putative reverse transcriptase [Soybean chlorotic mottle virus]P15629.2 RecName: Full=Enzymatic polyprotein; Includes: RecName: Full=Aspartic protease; Includes: RecName: Full=Endonuclease; Includes: RecName: Full=Reverse transcriptase [Soybean chlorotic mottle virus]CAC16945.1 putative reverse transcriptase [Soybean chlorotic mottle virus]
MNTEIVQKHRVLTKGNPNVTFIKVSIGKRNFLAYIDTGATLCFGKRKISNNWEILKQPKEIIIADKSKHYIREAISNVFLKIENKEFLIPIIYLHDSGLDLIIGNNFLKLYQPFIQRLETIELRWKNLNNPKESQMISTKILTKNEVLKLSFEKIHICLEKYLFFKTIEEQLEEVCSEHPLDETKNKNGLLIEIRLKDPLQEINVTNRIPYTIRDVQEFKEECEDLLKKGLIRESQSPHSAPAFYVENHNEIKRGKRRMVINYKKMNEATIGDSYKLPRKDFILEKIKGSLWFSSLDAKSGYYQLRLHENTKPLTAFSCPPQKHYEWNVLSFGLKQAPSIYQRFMDQSLKGLEHICLAYIDDILIFTKGSKEQHVNDVRIVLQRIKEKGIIISKKKSKLIQQEIEYLGLKIQGNGEIDLSPHTQEKILQFPDELEDRKQIQRFLGCINYIANEGFFKNLALERKHLQKKISVKNPWKWDTIDTKMVQSIKGKIQSLPKLYNASIQDFLIVETDASQHSWSGCLRALPKGKQKIGLDEFGIPTADLCTGSSSASSDNSPAEIDKCHSASKQDTHVASKIKKLENELLLCKYVSGTFTDTETRYPIAELEVLAGVKVLEKWRIDLLQTRFLLRTDSKYFAGFCRYNIKTDYRNGRLIRWQLRLQAYQPYVELIKSENNPFADTLTREWSKPSSS